MGKGEHANMETGQSLRTTISVELGHNDREPIKTMLGGQTYGKAPTVTVECVHEGIADDDENAALWHDDALTAATQCARVILEGVGLAPKSDSASEHGNVYVVVKGDTSGLDTALANARAAVERIDTRRPSPMAAETKGGATDREGRIMRADETADEYVQHDTSLPVEDGGEHPRYRDPALENIAVEVGVAMFGEGYRDWLDTEDQYARAMRERGAGAIRDSILYREAKS